MILLFKQEFEEKILNGTKIHSIRLDPENRWKPGRKIHFSTGVRMKNFIINYHCFKKGICVSTQKISIYPIEGYPDPYYDPYYDSYYDSYDIYIDSEFYGNVNKLAINDGFEDYFNFMYFFNESFSGTIVHWTDFRY